MIETVVVAIALLGAFGYLVYKTKNAFKSMRSIAVLIVTTILALILLGNWASGTIDESFATCGMCGGNGRFLGKSCFGCDGTGVATEKSFDNAWCFWAALIVLGVGYFTALPGRHEAKQLVGKPVKFVGEICSIDRNRESITVTPQSEVPWKITSYGGNAICYLSDISHKAFVANKTLYDTVTIEGIILSENPITSTNPVRTYSIKVTEISN
jgi:hypothetical protein